MRHILLLLALTATGMATWTTFLVDSSPGNTGTSIALSAGGDVIHIAYYGDSDLNYARHDTSGWFVDLLDAWSGVHNRGPSLRLDPLGRPGIAYYRGTPWLARWTGTGWQREEIDADSSGDYISLAFDSRGQPHVAYNKGGVLRPSILKYAWQDSTGWHIETVDATNSGYDCVLGFDPAGNPVIADCSSWSSGALFYRVRGESGWTRQTLLGADASQSYLDLDSAGRPHISYYWTGDDDYDLRFAWLENDTWRFDTVDHGLQPYKRGWDNCITVDRRGLCHISYHAHNERELRYAWGRPDNWVIEIVDAVGMWNLTSSIAVDPAGRPFIAYCDQDEGDALYVAIRDEPVAVSESHLPAVRKCPLPAGIFRSTVNCQVSTSAIHSSLFDRAGQRVMPLVPGLNDLSRLAPGVYFLGQTSEAGRVENRKIIVTR